MVRNRRKYNVKGKSTVPLNYGIWYFQGPIFHTVRTSYTTFMNCYLEKK